MSSRQTVELKRIERIETEDAHADAPQQSAVSDCCEKIRELAYSKWDAAGRPSGDGVDFWLQAGTDVVANAPPSRPK